MPTISPVFTHMLSQVTASNWFTAASDDFHWTTLCVSVFQFWMSMCKFLYPVVNSLRWQTIHATHRMHIFMNLDGQLCFHPQKANHKKLIYDCTLLQHSHQLWPPQTHHLHMCNLFGLWNHPGMCSQLLLQTPTHLTYKYWTAIIFDLVTHLHTHT